MSGERRNDWEYHSPGLWTSSKSITYVLNLESKHFVKRRASAGKEINHQGNAL